MQSLWLFSFLLAFAHANQKVAQCPPSKSAVERSLLDARIPGLAAVVVNANGVVYEQGFGSTSPPIFANLHPVDPVRSVFVLASISKTFIAVAVMQLVELHLLDLDTDINAYLSLDIRVIHPLYPNHTITMRHLLSHTASIGPNFREEMKHYVPGDDFTKTNLSEIILPYLSEKGNWLPDPPGTVVNYSNVGAGFAAVIVERIAHTSFEAYLHEKILQPLCIDRKEASYRLSDFQERQNDLIEHYIFNTSWLGQAQDWLPQLNFTIAGGASDWLHIAPFGISNYPAGLLRTSAHTLSTYLQAFLNGFPSLLTDPSSVDEMLRVKPNASLDVQFGLIWNWQTISGRRLIGHRGTVPGIANTMVANENRTLGVVILSSGDTSKSDSETMKVQETIQTLMLQLFDCFE